MHPTPMIELLKGLRGDAGCMGKASAMYLMLHYMLMSCIGPFRVCISIDVIAASDRFVPVYPLM